MFSKTFLAMVASQIVAGLVLYFVLARFEPSRQLVAKIIGPQ